MRHSRSDWKKSLGGVLAFAALAVIGGLVVVAVYQTTHEINFRALVGTLRAMPQRAILAALGATVASYTILLANDLMALRYAGAKPPLTAMLLASFCGYALGNAIGCGSLSGGAVRYRVYAAAGLSAAQIARTTFFIAAAFALGVAATTALGLAMRAREIAPLVALSPSLLRGVAGLALAFVVGFLVCCATGRTTLRLGPLRIELPSHRLALAQLGISIIDIVAAAASFWVLLPPIGIDFAGFATIYVAALGLGVLSHAPGGLGVFEAAILYAVGGAGPPSAVAAALLAYRAIYFLLPLVVATALLAGSEISHYLGGAARTGRREAGNVR